MLKDKIEKLFENVLDTPGFYRLGDPRSRIRKYTGDDALNFEFRFKQAYDGAREEGYSSEDAIEYAKDQTSSMQAGLSPDAINKVIAKYNDSGTESKPEDDLSGKATIRIQGKDF